MGPKFSQKSIRTLSLSELDESLSDDEELEELLVESLSLEESLEDELLLLLESEELVVEALSEVTSAFSVLQGSLDSDVMVLLLATGYVALSSDDASSPAPNLLGGSSSSLVLLLCLRFNEFEP